MKAAFKFLSLMILIVLFSAWAAPLLFRVLPFEYERILNRLIMILSLGAIYVLYIRNRTRELFIDVLAGEGRVRWYLLGLVYGFFTLALILAIEYALGAVIWQVDMPRHGAAYYLFKAFTTGFAVGLFEEWFFRGFLVKSFHRALSLKWSIFWMNMCYGLSHFIEVGNLQGGARPSFINSLKLIFGMYTRDISPEMMGMGLVGLVIFGYLLTWAFLKTGSLYLSMGIHGGLVTALKFHGRIIRDAEPGWHWFFGDRQYYNGVLGWACLLLASGILVLLIRWLPWPKKELSWFRRKEIAAP